MKPLILISNDDGYEASGLHRLCDVAREFGDVVVVAPDRNASAKGLSLTTTRPLRVREIEHSEGIDIYSCDGTPVDCVKLGVEHFCPRQPDLVLSGINHGSNASINVIYSGTMGIALEAAVLGIGAVGFSLLSHSPKADFTAALPYVRRITSEVLTHGLPAGTALNVNIPCLGSEELRGIRICNQAPARWTDSYERRVDPIGRPYWWLTGKFVCPDPPEGSDEWALRKGYVAVVPVKPDYTSYETIDRLNHMASEEPLR